MPSNSACRNTGLGLAKRPCPSLAHLLLEATLPSSGEVQHEAAELRDFSGASSRTQTAGVMGDVAHSQLLNPCRGYEALLPETLCLAACRTCP